jgi:hypothetical protein
MSGIFEAMGLCKSGVTSIDPSRLVFTEELNTFQLAQRQGFLVIIQLVANEMFGEIGKLKTRHDLWIYVRKCYRCDLSISYVFALRLFMWIKQRISLAKVSVSEFILAL